jgi:agmatine deiminase
MEGGAVDFNGAGSVLTTESVLLNPNRNPGLSKTDVEEILKRWYGQEQVLWLGDGIEGDDTDGHVDDLARFLDERTIVTAIEDDPRDPNHPILEENLTRLAKLRDRRGRPFDILTIPMPRRVEREGQRLPATYLNFLFVNGALLVPTFHDRRTEKVALERLQRALPRRDVIGIDCRELIWGLGAIHCLTQQQPAA